MRRSTFLGGGARDIRQFLRACFPTARSTDRTLGRTVLFVRCDIPQSTMLKNAQAVDLCLTTQKVVLHIVRYYPPHATNQTKKLRPPIRDPRLPNRAADADAHISTTAGAISTKIEPTVRVRSFIDRLCHRRRSLSIATAALRRQLQRIAER